MHIIYTGKSVVLYYAANIEKLMFLIIAFSLPVNVAYKVIFYGNNFICINKCYEQRIPALLVWVFCLEFSNIDFSYDNCPSVTIYNANITGNIAPLGTIWINNLPQRIP